jgi:hypothetical protein
MKILIVRLIACRNRIVIKTVKRNKNFHAMYFFEPNITVLLHFSALVRPQLASYETYTMPYNSVDGVSAIVSQMLSASSISSSF